MDNNLFFNKKYLDDFSIILSENNIFYKDEKLSNIYNLLCAFKDRMLSTLDYFNEHKTKPSTEEELITFMVYACFLYDGFNILNKNIKNAIDDNFNKKTNEELPNYKMTNNYFENVMIDGRSFFTNENRVADYVFFEYMRAMVFAHPFKVDKRTQRLFMVDNEIHCSPFVLIYKYNISGVLQNCIGFRVYSNKRKEEIHDIFVPFDDFKAYLKSIYDTLPNFTNWAQDVINSHNEEWKKVKINRNKQPLEILHEIKEVLSSRFVDTYSIDDIIMYLSTECTVVDNELSVNKFKKSIIDKIPSICDAVDNLDYETMENITSFIYNTPRNLHTMAHYQLEKIFSYLDERSEHISELSNESWGLKQAEDFYQMFAKKWVKIDVYNMNYDEIKLLIRVACFLEIQSQKEDKEVV